MGREGRRGEGKMTTPIEFNGGRGLAKGAACYASTETCVETSILHVGRAGAAIRIVEIHGCHARERDAAVREYSARCAGDREAGNSCQSCSLSWATVQGPAINAPPITTPDHPRTAASAAGRHKSSSLQQASTCSSVLRQRLATVRGPAPDTVSQSRQSTGRASPGASSHPPLHAVACASVCSRGRVTSGQDLLHACDAPGPAGSADPQTPTRQAVSSSALCLVFFSSPPSRPPPPYPLSPAPGPQNQLAGLPGRRFLESLREGYFRATF